jgi:hypothetical protein
MSSVRDPYRKPSSDVRVVDFEQPTRPSDVHCHTLKDFRQELITNIANYRYQEEDFDRLEKVLQDQKEVITNIAKHHYNDARYTNIRPPLENTHTAWKVFLENIVVSPLDDGKLIYQSDAKTYSPQQWEQLFNAVSEYFWNNKDALDKRSIEMQLFSIAKLFTEPHRLPCLNQASHENPFYRMNPNIGLTILYLYAKKKAHHDKKAELAHRNTFFGRMINSVWDSRSTFTPSASIVNRPY